MGVGGCVNRPKLRSETYSGIGTFVRNTGNGSIAAGEVIDLRRRVTVAREAAVESPRGGRATAGSTVGGTGRGLGDSRGRGAARTGGAGTARGCIEDGAGSSPVCATGGATRRTPLTTAATRMTAPTPIATARGTQDRGG